MRGKKAKKEETREFDKWRQTVVAIIDSIRLVCLRYYLRASDEHVRPRHVLSLPGKMMSMRGIRTIPTIFANPDRSTFSASSKELTTRCEAVTRREGFIEAGRGAGNKRTRIVFGIE